MIKKNPQLQTEFKMPFEKEILVMFSNYHREKNPIAYYIRKCMQSNTKGCFQILQCSVRLSTAKEALTTCISHMVKWFLSTTLLLRKVIIFCSPACLSKDTTLVIKLYSTVGLPCKLIILLIWFTL